MELSLWCKEHNQPMRKIEKQINDAIASGNNLTKGNTVVTKVFEKGGEWFSDAYWHWRNVFYFRFNEYKDNIDRLAFFEELNYGWHEMYADDEFWGR